MEKWNTVVQHEGHTITYWRGRDGKLHDTAGSNSRTSILTEEVVRIIKFEREGISNVKVGKEFNVSATTVSNIRNRRKWTHVKREG